MKFRIIRQGDHWWAEVKYGWLEPWFSLHSVNTEAGALAAVVRVREEHAAALAKVRSRTVRYL